VNTNDSVVETGKNGAIEATATVTVNVVTAESVVNAANVVTRTSQAVPAVRWTLLINSMPQAFTGLDCSITMGLLMP
jgi:uridine phosphorylase